jgi:hypothetical protein
MTTRTRTFFQVRTYDGMDMDDDSLHAFEDFDSKVEAITYAKGEAKSNPRDEVVVVEVQEHEVWNSLSELTG